MSVLSTPPLVLNWTAFLHGVSFFASKRVAVERSEAAFSRLERQRIRQEKSRPADLATLGNKPQQSRNRRRARITQTEREAQSTSSGKCAMVNAISGTSQTTQLLSSSTSSTSSSARIAALEKQIKTKETEAEENKDPVQAATIAAEIAQLQTEIASLQAAANKSEAKEQESSSAASRQAEFDKEAPADKTGFWI
jgi:hypothetical protein